MDLYITVMSVGLTIGFALGTVTVLALVLAIKQIKAGEL